MDQQTVKHLEKQFAQLIAQIFESLEPGEIPFHPNQQTMHLMAKAAVTVYESAVENNRSASKQ